MLNHVFSSIYIDLDTLFDIPLAVIHSIDPQKVAEVIDEGYFTRTSDKFNCIDEAVYKEAYAQRDKHTLKNALVSEAYTFLTFFIRQTWTARVASPLRRAPKIVVNVYPYKLTDIEKHNIVLGVKIATSENADIELIDMNIKNIDAGYVKNNYAMMVMYNCWSWIDQCSDDKSFEHFACPNIQLAGPRLLKDNNIIKEMGGVDIFEAAEALASPFIRLKLYPADRFSTSLLRLTKDKEREAKQKV